MAGADKIYAGTKADKQAAQAKLDQERQIDDLYAQIGRLTTQLGSKKIWRNLTPAVSERPW